MMFAVTAALRLSSECEIRLDGDPVSKGFLPTVDNLAFSACAVPRQWQEAAAGFPAQISPILIPNGLASFSKND
jgi:hypothetical protein